MSDEYPRFVRCDADGLPDMTCILSDGDNPEYFILEDMPCPLIAHEVKTNKGRRVLFAHMKEVAVIEEMLPWHGDRDHYYKWQRMIDKLCAGDAQQG